MQRVRRHNIDDAHLFVHMADDALTAKSAKFVNMGDSYLNGKSAEALLYEHGRVRSKYKE